MLVVDIIEFRDGNRSRFLFPILKADRQYKKPVLLGKSRIVQIPLQMVRCYLFQRDYRPLFKKTYHQRIARNLKVMELE
jgi:hypothetical protein